MACGLEKIFLFNLFMNEAKGGALWISWVVGLVGWLVGLAIKALPHTLPETHYHFACGAYRIVT